MVENTVQRSSPHYCGQESCCCAFNTVVVAFPKIFMCPYYLLTHLKFISVAGISCKITQVKRMPTRLTFVRSEENDPLGLLPSTFSLHNQSLWGLSNHLLLLGRIPISKWDLRPNTKVQAFAPTVHKEEKKYKKSTQKNCMWNSKFWLNKVNLTNKKFLKTQPNDITFS